MGVNTGNALAANVVLAPTWWNMAIGQGSSVSAMATSKRSRFNCANNWSFSSSAEFLKNFLKKKLKKNSEKKNSEFFFKKKSEKISEKFLFA